MNYKALYDNDLQKLAYARFGKSLGSLKKLGRMEIIEELEAYDRFVESEKQRSKKTEEVICQSLENI